MKDLVIGAADLYDWSKIKNWAKSIRASGFDGDVVLLAYRLIQEQEILEKCAELNIDVIKCEHNNWGYPLNHNQMNRDTICHQMRLFHIWQYLTQTTEDYSWVVVTDVRDVIFQSNPSNWISELCRKYYDSQPDFLAASENTTYGQEIWNMENMIQGYGPYIAQQTKDYTVYNVGTMTGRAHVMQSMCLLLYTMGEGRYIPNDQSSFGIVVNQECVEDLWKLEMSRGWAFQCGSTIDPTKDIPQIEPLDKIYRLTPDGIVTLPNGTPYVMVHQYDRVPELNKLVENRYA